MAAVSSSEPSSTTSTAKPEPGDLARQEPVEGLPDDDLFVEARNDEHEEELFGRRPHEGAAGGDSTNKKNVYAIAMTIVAVAT